jgi:SAM-dependent methyltransferase
VLELFLAAIVLAFFPYSYIWAGLLAVALLGLPGIRARWGGAPYVRSSKKTQDTMFRFAGITPGETVFDLGCGDGTVIRRASRLGAQATGIEASLLTFLLAWCWCLPFRGARIRFGDLWKGDYANADVVFCYLLVSSMERFEKEVWPMLKPGCRVVSNSFRMKGLRPEKEEGNVFLYVKA